MSTASSRPYSVRDASGDMTHGSRFDSKPRRSARHFLNSRAKMIQAVSTARFCPSPSLISTPAGSTSNLTVLSKARVTPYQANFFRPRINRGSDAESPRKSLIRRPRLVHDQSGEMTRGSRFDCMAAAVASISCSPLHPAALQIDPPAAAGILPLGFRRVNLWRHRTNPSCARRTPSSGDAVTESG